MRPFFVSATRVIMLLSLALGLALAQDSDPKARRKAVSDLAKQGASAIPEITRYLKDPEASVRVESVKALVSIGTQQSLDPLLEATRDNDPEVQARAVEGLTNFYYPGYVETGLVSRVKSFGSAIKGRFFETANDQVIPLGIPVREDVISAIASVASGGSSLTSRAVAARALGVLRARPAIPQLLEALRSRDTQIILEVLTALQKIRDTSVGPQIAFLLRDLDTRVQVRTIETTGLLRNFAALEDLRQIYRTTRKQEVRRAALGAIAMMPDPGNVEMLRQAIYDKDDQVRAAAFEGLGRLKDEPSKGLVEGSFNGESKAKVRLAAAFATVLYGKLEMSEFSPLQYLVNTLNSSAFGGVAEGYLTELVREPPVEAQLLKTIETGTRLEKLGLCRVLAASGSPASLAKLEVLSRDADAEVGREALRAIQAIRARQ